MGNSSSRDKKETFSCRICQKILKTPVKLPCQCENVCKEHLLENRQTIKCSTCKKSFESNSIELIENAKLESNIISNLHLSKNEREAKVEIEKIFNRMQTLLDEVGKKHSEFNLMQADHFSNIRNEIDIRRECLIEESFRLNNNNNLGKIQSTSAELVEQLDLTEKSFKKNVENAIIIEINLAQEKEFLDDFFRTANISQESLLELKRSYESKRGKLENILDRFKLLEEHLRKNRFKTNEPFGKLISNVRINFKNVAIITVTTFNMSDFEKKEKKIDIYESNNCKKIKSLTGHVSKIHCLILFESDKLISGDDNNMILFWYLESGKCFKRIKDPHGAVFSLKILEDGRLVSVGYNQISIWDIHSFTCTFSLATQCKVAIKCLEQLPDNSYLLCGGSSGTIEAFDLSSTNHPEFSDISSINHLNIKIKEWSLYCLKALKSCNVFASGHSRNIRIWDNKSLEVIQTIQTTSAVLDLAFDSETNQLISASWDKIINIWNLGSGACTQILDHTNRVTCIKLNESIGKLISGSHDNTIKIWDLKSGECEKIIENTGPIEAFVLYELN